MGIVGAGWAMVVSELVATVLTWVVLSSALRGRDTRGWFLASGGADASDLLGGWSVHDQMRPSQKLIGLGGAVLGIGVGLWGATRPRAARSSPAGE